MRWPSVAAVAWYEEIHCTLKSVGPDANHVPVTESAHAATTSNVRFDGFRAGGRLVLPLALLALVAPLTACTDKTGGTAAPATSGAAVPAASAGAGGSASAAAGASAGANAAAAAFPESAPPSDGKFSAPSRNIACEMGAQETYCFILHKNWPDPAKPASCEGDVYGQELGIGGSGTAVNRCDGQPQLGIDMVAGKIKDSVPLLDYGHAFRLGSFRCASEQTLMRCENTATKHGFTMAKEAFTTY